MKVSLRTEILINLIILDTLVAEDTFHLLSEGGMYHQNSLLLIYIYIYVYMYIVCFSVCAAIGLFRGIGKAGFNFEYSKEDKIIHAVEIGAQINAFPKKIPIMATSNNKLLFFSLFVSYRFGMVIDPMNPEANKLTNIFKRKKAN